MTPGTTATSTATPLPGTSAGTYQAPTNDLQRAEALAAYGAMLLAPVLVRIERLQAENRSQAETIDEPRGALAAATRPPWYQRGAALLWWRR
jgi:hypothetical protein